MKVIATDNFARDNVSEWVVKENITEEEAKKIVEDHNSQMKGNDLWYYVIKPDDYQPYKWEP